MGSRVSNKWERIHSLHTLSVSDQQDIGDGLRWHFATMRNRLNQWLFNAYM